MSSIKHSVMYVTPEKARDWIEKHNPNNRPVKESHVERLARSMRGGSWLLTHQGIAFDKNGDLIDGQHRLLAVVLADIPVEMAISEGWPISTDVGGTEFRQMDALDSGKARTIGDHLSLSHGVSNSNAAAAICHVVANFCASVNKLTMQEALSIISIYGAHIDAVLSSVKFKPAKRAQVLGGLVFARAAAPDIVDKFAGLLSSGENIRKGMPVFALRSWLISDSPLARDRRVLKEATLNSIRHAIEGNDIVLIKRGDWGLNYFKLKQRGNVERVRVALGLS